MRSRILSVSTLGFLAVLPVAPALADAPPPPPGSRAPAPPVIGSHQIDRYDAIRNLQEKLRENPRALADWVILGELAHEVALDLPEDQAARYNQMSLDAYQKALALAPNNQGLKAAVQFARDQQQGQARFEKSRDQATQTYLDARRRDLEAANYTPSVRVATPPLPDRSVPPADASVSAQPAPAPAPVPAPLPAPATAVVSPAPAYAVPYTYQPLYSPTSPSPYTYNQYTSSYYPPNAYGAGTQPISAQRYLQQSLMNAAAGSIGRGLLPGR